MVRLLLLYTGLPVRAAGASCAGSAWAASARFARVGRELRGRRTRGSRGSGAPLRQVTGVWGIPHTRPLLGET